MNIGEIDIKKMCQTALYDDEATNTVVRVFEAVKDNELFCGIINGIVENHSFGEAKKKMPQLAENTGINEYEIALTVLTCFIDAIYGQYRSKGIPDEITRETLKDILYKIEECRTVYAVSGTFVFDWYGIFFTAEIVKLGRLEYEFVPKRFDFEGKSETVGDTVINDGDAYISVHIPSCGPLSPDEVEKSMKKAYLFFKDRRREDGKLFLRTGTWLLYPPYVALTREGSNMRRFAEKFTVIKVVEREKFGDAWRVFGTMSDDVKNYPEDTSLRKSLKEYMLSGKPYGVAIGVAVRENG